MTLPYREWTSIIIRTIAYNSIDNADTSIDRWTDLHIEDGIIGHGNDGADPKYWGWYPLIIATDDFELTPGADEIVDIGIDVELELDVNSAGVGSWDFFPTNMEYPTDPNSWDPDSVTGKYYDGVHQWGNYPPTGGGVQGDRPTLTIGDLPYSARLWMPSYFSGQAESNMAQENIFRVGFCFNFSNYDVSTPFYDNEYFKCKFTATKIIANFLNPVVNSLSRVKFSGDGGEELIITGLGFNQSDAELSSTSRYSYNDAATWDSIVDEIVFEGQEGQGNYTLLRTAGDFTVDSDTQITIPSMPAMKSGVYKIKLIKQHVLPGIEDIYVESYAGQFFADDTGKMTSGVSNLYGTFTVIIGSKPKAPVYGWEWAWKIAGELVWKYYAPIDMRGANRFYDGRILSTSAVTRSIDDFTGMFQISDCDVELASNDSEFQSLLARGYCKNQPIKLYFGWASEPWGWMQTYFQGIVDDYSIAGPTFRATIKDITQKYLRIKLPFYTVTTEEFPNAHPNAIGRAIPEVLGLHSLTTGENLGAIEALCVDTTANKYIASGHPLKSVLQVYSDNTLINPANYSISYGSDGKTYITFTSSQGDKKVTYNAQGYSLSSWNSSNGYIQNPAYILGFLLVYLAEVPIDYIDTNSLDTIASLFETQGWGECGKMALTTIEDATSILQKALFSFGIKMWPGKDGKLYFGRKDLTTLSSDVIIIAQTDCIGPPAIEFNLRDAVNHIKVQWDYYPAAEVYGGSKEFENSSSTTDFESDIEPQETWDYPYITCEDFINLRAGEDLTRLAYGNRTLSMRLPMDFIDIIDIFDTFILQDTYGLSPSGQGEEQHYYYVTSITYDFQNMTIDIKAADLQWLAGQCFIIGRCSEIENNYSQASQWMRNFGYVGDCDTDRLPENTPLKKICKCQ